MMGGGMDWGWGWMFSGGLMMVLFWGVLIALVVLAVRGLTGGASSTTNDTHVGATRREAGAPPLEILQARYARGEISREEYETIRRDLQTA
jgi:putative membrane protein